MGLWGVGGSGAKVSMTRRYAPRSVRTLPADFFIEYVGRFAGLARRSAGESPASGK